MKVLFLLFSALSVSADSFFVGLSLYNHHSAHKGVMLGVLSAVFCLCLTGSTIGYYLPERLTNYANLLAGACLLYIALRELYKTQSVFKLLSKSEDLYNLSLLGGASVGVDGFIGSLTITLQGYSPILTALLITLTHGLLLCLSKSASNKLKKFTRLEKLPYYLIMSLGAFKIVNCFL